MFQLMMMKMSEIRIPYEMFFDEDGIALDGGRVYIGKENEDPKEKKNRITVYSDSEFSSPINQPIQIAHGRAIVRGSPVTLFVKKTPFSILIQDRKKRTIYWNISVSSIFANESGTSSEGSAPSDISVNSLSLLRSENLSSGDVIFYNGVLFVATRGEGPGHFIDNGGTIIVPNDGDGSIAWVADLKDGVPIELFGAIADGVTDNANAFKAWANFCIETGEKGTAGPGVFLMSPTTLTDRGGNDVFLAEGRGGGPAVFLANIDTIKNSPLVSFDNVSPYIKNIHFSGNDYGIDSLSEIKSLVKLSNVDGGKFENCTFSNIGSAGLMLRGRVKNITVVESRFFNCGRESGFSNDAALAMFQDGSYEIENITIKDSFFLDSGFQAISISGKNIRIIGCRIDKAKNAGITTYYRNYDGGELKIGKNILISGNYIKNIKGSSGGGSGIHAIGINILVEKNDIEECDYSGVLVRSSKDFGGSKEIKIERNVIGRVSKTTNLDGAIKIEQDSDWVMRDFLISENKLEKAQNGLEESMKFAVVLSKVSGPFTPGKIKNLKIVNNNFSEFEKTDLLGGEFFNIDPSVWDVSTCERNNNVPTEDVDSIKLDLSFDSSMINDARQRHFFSTPFPPKTVFLSYVRNDLITYQSSSNGDVDFYNDGLYVNAPLSEGGGRIRLETEDLKIEKSVMLDKTITPEDFSHDGFYFRIPEEDLANESDMTSVEITCIARAY